MAQQGAAAADAASSSRLLAAHALGERDEDEDATPGPKQPLGTTSYPPLVTSLLGSGAPLPKRTFEVEDDDEPDSPESQGESRKAAQAAREAYMLLGWLAVATARGIRLLQVWSAVTLTWATVVVLGAFAGDLQPTQFVWVSCLLLLEALSLTVVTGPRLLFAASVFTYTGEYDDVVEWEASGRDLQYAAGRALGLLLLLFQLASALVRLCAAAVGVSLPARAFTLEPESTVTGTNIVFGMRVFYTLTVVGASLALGLVVHQFVALRRGDREPLMWVKYYHHILGENTSGGLVFPGEGFADFGIQSLAEEHARRKFAGNIYRSHRHFVDFLCASDFGLDLVEAYLDEGGRMFEEVAAVCLLGHWRDKGDVSRKLFAKLLDRVGFGSLGRAATQSVAEFLESGRRQLSELMSDSRIAELARFLADEVAEDDGDPVWVKCLAQLLAAARRDARLALVRKSMDEEELGRALVMQVETMIVPKTRPQPRPVPGRLRWCSGGGVWTGLARMGGRGGRSSRSLRLYPPRRRNLWALEVLRQLWGEGDPRFVSLLQRSGFETWRFEELYSDSLLLQADLRQVLGRIIGSGIHVVGTSTDVHALDRA